MKQNIQDSFFLLLFFLITACSARKDATPSKQQQPNILFISIDDLRPELNCYGKTQIKSPNIDKLAESGTVFRNAFCQQPICMASRASLLTGIYPHNEHLYSCKSVEELVPDLVTLNEHFAANGYATPAVGKVYHHSSDNEIQFGKDWSNEPPYSSLEGRGYYTEEAKIAIREHYNIDKIGSQKGPAWEKADIADSLYEDGYYANYAVRKLRELKNNDQPFFFSIGFRKPHLPFNAPQKYWDMYDKRDIQFASNPFMPANPTRFTDFNSGETRVATSTYPMAKSLFRIPSNSICCMAIMPPFLMPMHNWARFWMNWKHSAWRTTPL